MTEKEMFARREEEMDQKRYMESSCRKDTERRETNKRDTNKREGGHSHFIGGEIFPAK
jgi:hypothetical protein